jgi:histidinol phosphatase-like enzyme
VPLELALGAEELGDLGSADAFVLAFGWRPGVDAAWLARATERARERFAEASAVDVAVCAHPAGPPVCWCRPPLPGLWLAFARRHAVDPQKSVLVATEPAHRTMARTLGLETLAAVRSEKGNP